MSWLNTVAPLNMLLMSVTADVTHEPMLPLNDRRALEQARHVVDAANIPTRDRNALAVRARSSGGVAPPRQYEDAMVFTSSAFEANGDAYVHAVSDPV